MMRSKPLPLSGDMLDAVAHRFRLLGEPARLRLLQILENGEQTVTELAEAVEGNQANVSRHLTALYEAGILSRRRQGNSIYYGIADPVVFQLCELVCNSAREYSRTKLGALALPSRR